MKCKYLILVVIIFSFLVNPSANRGDMKRTGDQVPKDSDHDSLTSTDREIREMLDALREFHLIKELDLPEDRAKHIVEKIRYARRIKQSYLFQCYQIENKLDALLGFSDPDHSQINVVLKELDVVKKQYYQHIMEPDHELRMMLSPEERAKYVLFQRNFNKKLREVIASIRQQQATPTSKGNFLLRRQDTESVIRQPH
jgi:hypothetical protein